VTEAPSIAPRAWLTLVVTSLAVFMISIELTVITAYNIGVASLLLVSGWLADLHGWKRFFIVGTTVFGLASLMAGMAPSAGVLIGARALQSVGGALQYPAGLALLLSAFPPARHSTALGVYAGVGGLAAAVGPSLGALLVEGFGWRAVFLVNVPVVAFGVVAGKRWLTESRPARSPDRVDLVSVPLASIGVGAVILAIVKGREWGWDSAPVLAALVFGVAMVTVFVHRSRTHPAPLFDLALFRSRTYTIGNVGTVFFALAFFSWLVVLPTFIQSTWDWSVLKTGFAIAPSPMVAFLVSPPAGRLADRIGNGPLLTIGGVFGAAGSLLYLTRLDVEPGYVDGVLIPGLSVGVAAGLGFAQLVGASMRDVEPHQYGMAGAGRTTVFQLATALAIALGFTLVGEPSGAEEALTAYRRVAALGIVAFAAQAATFAFSYPRRRAGASSPDLE
jgi:EmrB/QacA subfamily drug resistance transporter